LLAHNIRACLLARPLKEFCFQSLGTLCIVGYHTACAEIRGRKFSGLFAWLLWRGVYLSKLPGLELGSSHRTREQGAECPIETMKKVPPLGC
jgi:NADH dehydrogenase FAD-containing subunit